MAEKKNKQNVLDLEKNVDDDSVAEDTEQEVEMDPAGF